MAINPNRLQAFAYATVLALAGGWILHIGRDVLVPLVFSVLVAYVIVGLAEQLARIPRLGPLLPERARYVLSVLVIMVALAGVAMLVVANFGAVVATAPKFQASRLDAIHAGAERLGMETAPTWGSLRQSVLGQLNLQRLLGSTVTSMLSVVATLIVVSLYVAFLLLERGAFPAKLANLSRDAATVARVRAIVHDINRKVGSYLALKTQVSILLGLVSWAAMAWAGLEFAAFWAVLIALLNYIPYLGSFLGVLFPAAYALMQFGDLNGVLLVLVPLSIAQFAIGSFLEPYLMGNSLNLSPFAILASLAAWSALWGVAGAFLAVPMTAVLALVCSSFEGTRGVAVLLSRGGEA